MKKVINITQSLISFPDFELNFTPGEIKEIEDSIADKLLRNPAIKKYAETVIKKVDVEIKNEEIK